VLCHASQNMKRVHCGPSWRPLRCASTFAAVQSFACTFTILRRINGRSHTMSPSEGFHSRLRTVRWQHRFASDSYEHLPYMLRTRLSLSGQRTAACTEARSKASGYPLSLLAKDGLR